MKNAAERQPPMAPFPARAQAMRAAPAPPPGAGAVLAPPQAIGHHRRMKRSRQLKPLSSEHHQALLVAFQLKKGLAGHGASAGAPKDLPGLALLARRFGEK